MTVIQVEDLAKQYFISGLQANYSTLRETLAQAVRWPLQAARMFVRPGALYQHSAVSIWALGGVSFTVGPGEIVGVIGRNGAGKSTLLKVLSQITPPTAGQVILRGRVGALLEVGTGFHQELTGRENIYLNGAVLGMRRKEIARKFDDIVAFAEVDQFIDTPLKRYSSGMFMRLAFAIAAHLESEILLVDEVLAVGDTAFQKKCLGKIGEVSRQGRTVLFVSHNMAAVQSLCQRVIWLAGGQIQADDATHPVIARYLQSVADSVTTQVWPDITTAPGNERIRLRRACVRALATDDPYVITVQSDFAIEIEFWNLLAENDLSLNLSLCNDLGITVLTTMPVPQPGSTSNTLPKGLLRSRCYVPGRLLNSGIYRVGLRVVENRQRVIYTHEDILGLEIQDLPMARGGWYGEWEGVVRPELRWDTELIEPC